MNMKGLAKKIRDMNKNSRGVVLMMTLSFLSVMLISSFALSRMIQNDINLIDQIKDLEQSRFTAEAGLHHALANMKKYGFAARSDFIGAMDTGTYNVTYSSVTGRYLITSVGTVNGISCTVSAEVADNTPTALSYFAAAGNDIKIHSLVSNANIEGDLHANTDILLKSGFVTSWLRINGTVSATGIVKEGHKYDQGVGDKWDDNLVINGDNDDTAAVLENQPRVTFPTFDYAYYKSVAIANGDYYSGSTVFHDMDLVPAGGIIYVDGDVVFNGSNTLAGGIVAERIKILGSLEQSKAGDMNVIIAKDDDIRVRGRLYTEEALVFAAKDLESIDVLAEIELNGVVLAKRDIEMWNVQSFVTYSYIPVAPVGMGNSSGEEPFRVISWNN